MVALLALAPMASASLIEEATGWGYQRDANLPGDASDDCDFARPIDFPSIVDGLVVAEDDHADFYLLDVPEGHVGEALVLHLEAWPSIGSSAPVEVRPDLDLYVYEPGCATYLASSRSYDGLETLEYRPAHAGPHALLVFLYAPVADMPFASVGAPLPVPQLGYTLTIG